MPTFMLNPRTGKRTRKNMRSQWLVLERRVPSHFPYIASSLWNSNGLPRKILRSR